MRRVALAFGALVVMGAVGCDDDSRGFQKVALGTCTGAAGTATYEAVPSGTAPATVANAFVALLDGGDRLSVGLGVGETQTGTCALTGGSSDVVAQVKSQSLGTFDMPKHGSVTYDDGTGATAAPSATVSVDGYDPSGAGSVCGSIAAMFGGGMLLVDFTAAVYCRQD